MFITCKIHIYAYNFGEKECWFLKPTTCMIEFFPAFSTFCAFCQRFWKGAFLFENKGIESRTLMIDWLTVAFRPVREYFTLRGSHQWRWRAIPKYESFTLEAHYCFNLWKNPETF